MSEDHAKLHLICDSTPLNFVFADYVLDYTDLHFRSSVTFCSIKPVKLT